MLEDKDLIAIQEARSKVEMAYAAWQQYCKYDQQQVDAIVEAAAAAARENARKLAELAVEETTYGNVEDKIAKNLLNADFLPRAMRGMRTIGMLREIPEKKIVEFAVPVGVVAAIVPTTNPTSTVIYKTLISLKAGNGIVLSPHPRAKNCSCYTADIMIRAGLSAGMPEGLVQCLTNVTQQSTQELMRHKRTGVILATGGHGLVKAAYSSGKPAFGVGPGNVPVLLERSANVADSVAMVVTGKAFDYGTVCSSEQSLVAPADLKDQVLAELKKNKAYLCTPEQAKALGDLLISPEGLVKPECVGQSPVKIARMAGFQAPEDSSILVAEIHGVGREHPLSREKLSPVLSVLFTAGFEESMDACEAILRFGGLGHTCVIHSNDQERIRRYGARMPANRVLVNTPAPTGSVGLTTNVFPAMTLGCGAAAGNVTSDNVGPQHLYNIRRLAWVVRTAEEAFSVSADVGMPRPVALPAPARAAAQAAGARAGGITPEMVEAIVERVLARKGGARSGAAPTAASLAAQVVDRFLGSGAKSNGGSASSAAGCGCAVPAAAPAPTARAMAPVPPKPEPEVRITDFVCEKDVRDAIEAGRKIFIGPKTIVTPSARETAGAGDILVLAKRD